MNNDSGRVQQVCRIFSETLLLCATFFALACSSHVSKPPILSEYNPDGTVLDYIKDFEQMGDRNYWTPTSLDYTPQQPWQVYIEVETDDFFGVRLRDENSKESRLLFTLWAADVGSGVSARVRWSTDRKALQITGDTKGFSYKPIPDADPSKFESFNFIYLIDEDKMYSMPRGVPPLQSSIR